MFDRQTPKHQMHTLIVVGLSGAALVAAPALPKQGVPGITSKRSNMNKV